MPICLVFASKTNFFVKIIDFILFVVRSYNLGFVVGTSIIKFFRHIISLTFTGFEIFNFLTLKTSVILKLGKS